MARPETHPGVEGGGAEEGAEGSGSTPPADVVRPGTGVVRPGTGVVRPGTGVVRPGTASPTDAATAKASAAIPEAPEKPLEPIHVVLPVIPLLPAKQGFLDRLVAPKPKKTEAELAEEEAQRRTDEARKAEEAQRKSEAQARKAAEEAGRAEAEARAKADAKARAKTEEEARKAGEGARKAEEKVRKAEEKTRRAEAKAREKTARDDEGDDFDEGDEYQDEPPSPSRGFSGPAAPPISPPTRPAPPGPGGPSAPPRPGQAPMSPPRPGARPAPPGRSFAPSAPPTGRPQRASDRRVDYDERRVDYAARPSRRPLRHWIAAAAVLVALGGGSAAIGGAAIPAETIQFTDGISTGDTAPILAGLSANAPRPTVGGVAAAIGPLLADSALGGAVAGSIVDGLTGEPLYDINGTTAMTPASAAKLLTAAAVLHTRGPNYRIATRAVAGSSPGEVVLVGAGDPTLTAGASSRFRGAGRLDLLADQVRKSLGGNALTRVVIDTSLYQGSTTGPGWDAADLSSSNICHIFALMTDGARVDPVNGRSACNAQPDLAAGQLFATAVGFSGTVSYGSAPQGAKVLGEVFSPPIASLVEMMLVDSDNVVAEAMARQVALAKGQPASFAGGAAATKAALADLGVQSPNPLGLADGSGFSYASQVSVNQLTAILFRASSPNYPQLRALMSGLPVAGYSGTLFNRDQGVGMGNVRAKTGTLNGVNALAGYVVDADGRLLAFALVGNGTANRVRAEGALDKVAAGIASCGCR